MGLQQQLSALKLSEESLEKLAQFAILLHEWNGVHNLTGAKSIVAIEENIVDSLLPLDFIETPQSVLDVGTGAGFPGLILAIALPNTPMVLCEPIKKRTSFLKYAAMTLSLTNVTVVAKRVEALAHEPFALITSRAVTNTALLLELTEHLSHQETRYLFYKGEQVFDELSDVLAKVDYDIVQEKRRNYLYIKALA